MVGVLSCDLFFQPAQTFHPDPLWALRSQVTRGPYTIRLERVRDVPDAVAEARVTAAQFLSGQFCYYLPYGLQLELTKVPKLPTHRCENGLRRMIAASTRVCVCPGKVWSHLEGEGLVGCHMAYARLPPA